MDCEVSLPGGFRRSLPTVYPPKQLSGIAYMLSMGVCGMVLVVIGSTFEDLARQVGKQTTELGSVFVVRGIGSIIGAASTSKLYHWFPGNWVLTGSLLIMIMLILMPFTVFVTQLHIYFFILGLSAAITDTGCQLMTRRLHGHEAGPWLGANAAVFGISGAAVPLLELLSTDTVVRYLVFASAVFVVVSLMSSLAFTYKTDNGRADKLRSGSSSSDSQDGLGARARSRDAHRHPVTHALFPHDAEVVIALILFFYVGGGVTCTAYLRSYVNQTHVLGAVHKDKLFSLLWLCITAGRFVGTYLQQWLTVNDLTAAMAAVCVCGSAPMFLVYLYPNSPLLMWICVAGYGFFHGPTVGFTQDFNNRLTPVCEKAMAIVMLGLVCGASAMPYLNAFLWNTCGLGPPALLLLVGSSMMLPLPLIFVARVLSANRSGSGHAPGGFALVKGITPETVTSRLNASDNKYRTYDSVSGAESAALQLQVEAESPRMEEVGLYLTYDIPIGSGDSDDDSSDDEV
jgi:fucose permease